MLIRVYINGTLSQEKNVFKPVITIGRATGSDVRIRESEVSSEHLEIHDTDNGLLLIDKGSMNGTFIDNQRMKAHKGYVIKPDVPVHIGEAIALAILPSPDDVAPEESEEEAAPVKTKMTTTENLGLDFTGIRHVQMGERVIKKFKPVRRHKDEISREAARKKKADKSYILEIVGVVIILALILTYFRP